MVVAGLMSWLFPPTVTGCGASEQRKPRGREMWTWQLQVRPASVKWWHRWGGSAQLPQSWQKFLHPDTMLPLHFFVTVCLVHQDKPPASWCLSWPRHSHCRRGQATAPSGILVHGTPLKLPQRSPGSCCPSYNPGTAVRI